MKYLVMECHKGYAVLLDEEGKFVKAANLNYKVGQTVENIIMQKHEEKTTVHSLNTWIKPMFAMAACLCIMFFGVWQYMLMPVGYVRLKINPDVNMVINRNDRVIGMEALNDDGAILIDKYDYRWKDVKKVSDDMAQRAIDMGYLSEGGKITLTVSSDKEEWRIVTEEKLVTELEIYVGETIEIVTKEENDKTVIEVAGTTAASEDNQNVDSTTANKDNTDYNDTDYVGTDYNNTDYDGTDYDGTDYDDQSDYDDDSPYYEDDDSGYEEEQNDSPFHEETDGTTDYFDDESEDDEDSDYDDYPDAEDDDQQEEVSDYDEEEIDDEEIDDDELSDYEDDEDSDDDDDAEEYEDSDYDDENEDDDEDDD